MSQTEPLSLRVSSQSLFTCIQILIVRITEDIGLNLNFLLIATDPEQRAEVSWVSQHPRVF